MKCVRVGIVGAGLAGTHRARVVHADTDAQLVAVCDVEHAHAEETAMRWGVPDCRVTTDWMEVVNDAVDVVVVSTVHKFLAPITIAALHAGKDVLCEKPLGRSVVEAREMVKAACEAGRLLKTGFNHRYYPALQRAHRLLWDGVIGEPMYLRVVYGHGGRPGYEREWRMDADLAGGGQVLDQGVHALDLARWFLGEYDRVFSRLTTDFWEVAPLEDNAFTILWTGDGKTAFLHTSVTQWRNRFDFEVYGKDGYLRIEGLGKSYGVGRLTLGKRLPQGGPPDETYWEFPGEDDSWSAEWADFTAALREGRHPLGDGEDGLRTMELTDAIYRSSCSGASVGVHRTDNH
ncbi:MAG: Gfo/Idh/MocA family oxidoreductase [Candidatus Latescibacteria bacterium]|nr:Gfo/Idh/MocA family oxidoreductase [Candidatus Latescibacterota bacterium]